MSAGIDKYLYVGVNRPKGDRDIWVKYAQSERVGSPREVQHDLVRHALEQLGIRDNIEIVSMADIQAGTGMGTSGSYLVALLAALLALLRKPLHRHELAELACHIEIDLAGHPVGKQDQFAAAFGGINSYAIGRDGRVVVTELAVPQQMIRDLEAGTLMYFTGTTRSSGQVLSQQRAATLSLHANMLDNLAATKQIGLAAQEALVAGDLQSFAATLRDHWTLKRRRTADLSSDLVDEVHAAAMRAGALGGKLVGAGGGGFLMLLCEPGGTKQVRGAVERFGLVEMPFRFDWEGAKVIADV